MSTTAQSEFEKYLEAQKIKNAAGLKAQGAALQNNLTQTKNILEQNYGRKAQELTQQKQSAMETADISYQKLMKYLPEYHASMGLYGSGASETALLDAAARQRATQGQILANYNSGVNAAASERDQGIYTAEQSFNKDLMSLYAQADAQKKTEEAETKAEYDTKLAKAESELKNYTYDKDGLNQYWESMDEDAKTQLQPLYDQILRDTVKSEMESFSGTAKEFETRYGGYIEDGYGDVYYSKYDSLSGNASIVGTVSGDRKNSNQEPRIGDDVKVKVGYDNYTLEIARDQDIPDHVSNFADRNGIAVGQAFAYQGEIYYKREYGICKLIGKGNKKNEKYTKVVNALMGSE